MSQTLQQKLRESEQRNGELRQQLAASLEAQQVLRAENEALRRQLQALPSAQQPSSGALSSFIVAEGQGGPDAAAARYDYQALVEATKAQQASTNLGHRPAVGYGTPRFGHQLRVVVHGAG